MNWISRCTLPETVREKFIDKSYSHPCKKLRKYLTKYLNSQTTTSEHLQELYLLSFDKKQSVEGRPTNHFPKDSERYLTKERSKSSMANIFTYPYVEDSTRYSKTDNRVLSSLLCNGRDISMSHCFKSVTSSSYAEESSHFTNTRRNDSKIKKRNGFTENRENTASENTVPKDTCHGDLESDITTDGCMEDCQKDLTESLKHEYLENQYNETTETKNVAPGNIPPFNKEYNNYTCYNFLTNKEKLTKLKGPLERKSTKHRRKLIKGRPSYEKGKIDNKRNHSSATTRNEVKHKTTATSEDGSRDDEKGEDVTRTICHQNLTELPTFHSYNETIVSTHLDAYEDPFFTEHSSVKNKYSLLKSNSLKQTATLEAVSKNDSSKVTDVSDLDNLPCDENRPLADAYLATTLEQEPPDDYIDESRDDSESHIGQCNVEVDNESLDTVDVSAWSSNSEHRCPLQNANLGCLPLSELSLASLPAELRHVVFLNLINSFSTQVVKIIKRCQKCIANLDTKECECVTGTGYLLGRSPEIEVPQGSRKGLGSIYIATSNQLVLDNASARNCLVEFSSLHHSFHKGRILRGHSVQHIDEAGEINTYLKCKTHDLQLIYKINAIQAEIKTRTDDLPLTIKRRLTKMAFVIGYSHGDCLTLSYSESTMIRRRLVKEVVEGKEQYWLKNIATCSNDNDHSDVRVLLYTAMTCPGCVGAPILTYQELKSDGKIKLSLNIWTHQGVLKTSGFGCSSIKDSVLNLNSTKNNTLSVLPMALSNKMMKSIPRIQPSRIFMPEFSENRCLRSDKSDLWSKDEKQVCLTLNMAAIAVTQV
ncbi:hypothetical protein BgiBS90_007811 [Biomphalaria glabrata]|nr:hypothetical protein BgiBS90_007811 [Biomphalaria glabrata]